MGWARTIIAFLVAGLSGACAPDPMAPDGEDRRAVRIVSLDYCADQYVLKLVDRDRILAVSPDATRAFSYMRETAKGMAWVRPRAEDVLVLKPDLVVRTYGGGPRATAFFERAGVPVLQLRFASDLASLTDLIEEVADGLGEPERGAALRADMQRRLEALPQGATRPEALYMTPAGVTTGPGTLVHDMLRVAGLANFQTQPGWRALPLERLAYERPDLVVAAFFDQMTNHPDGWSAARHPVARRQMETLPTVPLQGAWTACGGWFLVDAIETLAAAGAATTAEETTP